jgi:hypothetical protein
MALAADFRLGALVKERGPVVNLGELISVGGFLHDGMAGNAPHSPSRVRASFPIGLYAALMTSEAGLVLDSYGLS